MFDIPIEQPAQIVKYLFEVSYMPETDRWNVSRHPDGDIRYSDGRIVRASGTFNSIGLISSIDNEHIEAKLIKAINTIEGNGDEQCMLLTT